MRKIIQEYQDEKRQTVSRWRYRKRSSRSRPHLHVACGTSYHAGLVGKQYIEDWAKVPVEVHVASEFFTTCRFYRKSRCSSSFLNLGETADSRAVLVQVKELGHKALTITNVPGSTLS
ncbi:SIS domain-containing protein [Bacillus sp. SL00103]